MAAFTGMARYMAGVTPRHRPAKPCKANRSTDQAGVKTQLCRIMRGLRQCLYNRAFLQELLPSMDCMMQLLLLHWLGETLRKHARNTGIRQLASRQRLLTSTSRERLRQSMVPLNCGLLRESAWILDLMVSMGNMLPHRPKPAITPAPITCRDRRQQQVYVTNSLQEILRVRTSQLAQLQASCLLQKVIAPLAHTATVLLQRLGSCFSCQHCHRCDSQAAAIMSRPGVV
jgi:hypothetical protein